MAELFGFKFERIKDDKGGEKFTAPSSNDGTIDLSGGGFYSQVLDADGRDRTEQDLIRRYRDISQQPECDSAIEDIVNEGIVSDERDQSVSIVLDRLPYPKRIKDRIKEEFDGVLRLLDFDTKGHDIFRRWYVDGRLYYHKVIDKKNSKLGVMELRYIEPRKIKKVRELVKQPKNGSSINLVKKVEEYYLYNEKGMAMTGTSEGIRISPDSITYCPSGLVDANKGHVLSYLHKSIKPVNQLRMIEDALVIYRISRAPERRIFYIDVGNLPKIKAEQYLKDVMNRYRNKLVYDASTGEIRDDRNHMSMLEDFWLPRREGGRGTEITTLPGGSNLGEIDDIVYFQRKLYRSLNVPISRLEAEQGFSLGRSTEITRDELKFTKFVQRLRKKFTPLFTDILKTQLVLKGVITLEDWDNMSQHIQYDFMQDGHFAELKKAEILREQVDMLGTIDSYIGTFFSKKWVQRNVLQMTDHEIDDMQKEINKEAGEDVEDGGVDLPRDTDGVTRYPSQGGNIIGADDIDKYDNNEPPKQGGDDNE
jgi:5S rRNA maturation endonuclease (ribonuclease M5)